MKRETPFDDGQTKTIILSKSAKSNTSRADTRYYVVRQSIAYCLALDSLLLIAYFLTSKNCLHLSFGSLLSTPGSNMSDKSGKDAAAPSSSAAALLNQPIVLDTGTGTTRAGFAGGTKPKVCPCV